MFICPFQNLFNLTCWHGRFKTRLKTISPGTITSSLSFLSDKLLRLTNWKVWQTTAKPTCGCSLSYFVAAKASDTLLALKMSELGTICYFLRIKNSCVGQQSTPSWIYICFCIKLRIFSFFGLLEECQSSHPSLQYIATCFSHSIDILMPKGIS